MAIAGIIEARRKVLDGTDLALVAGFIHNCLAERDHPFQPVDAQYAAGLCQNQGVLRGFSDDMPVSLSTCQSSSSRTHIADFRLIPTLDDVVNQLQNDGPIFVDLYVPKETFFVHRGSGVLSFPPIPEKPLLHSMVLIGLDFRNGQRLAVVQNSAGLTWGINGRAAITIGSGGLLTDRQPLKIII